MEKKIQNVASVIVFLILSVFITRNACNYIQNEARIKNHLREVCVVPYESKDQETFCQHFEKENYHYGDFYVMFDDIFCNSNVLYMVGLVVISSSIYASLYYKNKKNLKEIEKEDYKVLQKKMLLNTYKPVLAFVSAAIYAMILCYIYNRGFSYDISSYAGHWSLNMIKHAYIFIPLFLFNLTIHGLLFANATYLFIRRFPSIIVSSVLGFACLFAIEGFYEIFIEAIIINNLFKISITSFFTIFNFLTFRDFFCSIVPIATLILSYVLIYIVYYQKDKLIKDLKKEHKKPILGLKFS